MEPPDQIRLYFQAWNDHNADAILSTFDVGGTYQDPSTGAPISGETLRAYVENLWSAFPDLSFEEESIGQTAQDRVATQWIMRGTNKGSLMGLPPSGKAIEVRGADFFLLNKNGIAAVTGYFDKDEVPRQIGLNILVQPFEIGPFKFGRAVSVHTGKTVEPAAFAITSADAVDDAAMQRFRDGGRDTLREMLATDGFIGAVTAEIGRRLITVTAWESPEASRRMMREGVHGQLMKGTYDGSMTKYSVTSVWTKHHVNPVLIRCDVCGKMNPVLAEARNCACGVEVGGPRPYW